jgi:hypothetical protein
MNHCFALAARMQPHKGGSSAQDGENHGKHGNHSAAHNIPAALLLLKILRAGIRRKLKLSHNPSYPAALFQVTRRILARLGKAIRLSTQFIRLGRRI